MSAKKLEPESQYNGLDTNNDGIISDAEWEQSERMV